MIRIVIVGAGLIGPRHAQSVLSNANTSLVALIDPSPSAESIAERLQTNYFPSIEAMLQTIPVPDAAIVCTPNNTHVSVTRSLLSHGMHVLLEKPISDTVASGRDLLEFASQQEHRHLRILVGHHRRFNPYVRKTKEIIDSGSLGRIIAVNGLWTLFKPDDYFAAAPWRRSSSSGGGVIPINFVHDVDILHYLFGPIVRIHAEKTLHQRQDPSHDAEEGAAIIIRFASGVVGTFLVCDATPSPYNFESGTGENPLIPKMDGGADFYRVFGSEASLSVPDMTRWNYDGTEKSWNQPLTRDRFAVEEETSFDLQLKHFVDVIQGEEPSCSGEDALRALMACEAVRKAMEGDGRSIDL
ncbi:hypothetical protein EYZ11_001768 [Aspergillus tanneri]|uniref:Gfo/Idh/MocA-like oxidoreductase N-terminal domain-containing protein n=1 Tax=Aspergillus tanneri TaxID=1220188 RepID=A0A4S3JSI5_9EURO|nr:hypothetical protein EYZ11_001768 [Aspergillus tanneri]